MAHVLFNNLKRVSFENIRPILGLEAKKRGPLLQNILGRIFIRNQRPPDVFTKKKKERPPDAFVYYFPFDNNFLAILRVY